MVRMRPALPANNPPNPLLFERPIAGRQSLQSTSQFLKFLNSYLKYLDRILTAGKISPNVYTAPLLEPPIYSGDRAQWL